MPYFLQPNGRVAHLDFAEHAYMLPAGSEPLDDATALRIAAETNAAETPPPDPATTARQYLTSTDWYVMRAQETGEPIPEEVTAQRAAARKVLSGA